MGIGQLGNGARKFAVSLEYWWLKLVSFWVANVDVGRVGAPKLKTPAFCDGIDVGFSRRVGSAMFCPKSVEFWSSLNDNPIERRFASKVGAGDWYHATF